MHHLRRIIPLLILVVIAAAAYRYWPEPDVGSNDLLGYVEGETILIAAPAPGRLVELAVAEGDSVTAGDLVFRLDSDHEEQALASAQAALAGSRATLVDLQAAVQRPEEIDVLEASRRQVAATLAQAESDLERQRLLFADGFVSQARLDDATAAHDEAQAALMQIDRSIAAARLAARQGRIDAAQAEVVQRQAALARAEIDLRDRSVEAEQAGRILEIFYRQGERVGALTPVVELLPPENIVVRFFAPQAELAGLAPGQRVGVTCDGCPPGLQAEIIFIASQAEFSPPEIFTREERAKLVFLIKARPLEANGILKPGLPVEVALPGPS